MKHKGGRDLREAQTIDQIAKKENKRVEGWLLFYEDRLREYENDRAEIVRTTSPSLFDGLKGPGISNPTGRMGVKLMELQEREQWLRLVEEVERKLPQKLRIYLRVRREYRHNAGNQGWVVRVQRDYAATMARLTGLPEERHWIDSRRTFWVWWERIVEYAARMAAKEGLL